jgi:hypothetical protein
VTDTDAATDVIDGQGGRHARSAVLVAVAVVGVLAVALLLALAVGGDDAPAVSPARSGLGAEAATGRARPLVADPPPAPSASATPGPATDASGTASGFLTAEATGEFETAFTYLTPDERAAFGSPARYVAEHADLLGPVTGFEIRSVEPDPADPDRAVVVADVGFRPTLDVVVGLIPAQTTARMPVHRGDDGWTVSLADTTFEPILPSDGQAAADARAYVAGAAACQAPPTGYGGRLLGSPDLLEGLCDAAGGIRVGEITSFDDPVRTGPFITAFGPDVTTWARVAPVTSPTALRLVLAPFGDHWTVIGVLPPP